jgi:hypothetical protein
MSQYTALKHYHISLPLEWPSAGRAAALNSQIDGYGRTRRHLSADAVIAMAGPTLVVEAAVRPGNGGASALWRHNDVGSGADAVDAPAGQALVVEAAIRAADGRAAAALRAGSCESREGD